MRDYGYNCGYYKPALSGAIRQPDGTLLPGDADFVLKFAGLDIEPKTCVGYCFEEAVSPHLAAVRCGVSVLNDKIKAKYNELAHSYDYLIVEGAGGITCPFNLENQILLLPDIIKNLDLDILIVADGGLGTINSVLLTVEYAKSKNLNIKGIILNNYDKTDFMHIDNRLQIERLTGISVIATVANGEKDLDIEKEDLIKVFS